MIYITGDTHGAQIRFIEGNMPGEPEWTKDDVLIVCGDFGFVCTGIHKTDGGIRGAKVYVSSRRSVREHL